MTKNMMLRSGGWSNGEFLTVISQTPDAQIVRVSAPKANNEMRTTGYQWRTRDAVENFDRLADLKKAHPEK